jgi:ABC-2 type transport system ATP-binding protein
MTVPIIEVDRLSRVYSMPIRREGVLGPIANLFVRRYRTLEALRGINFRVQPGEIVGLIGPNGAGKSTTIKILSGILVPSAGTVRFMGVVPHQNRQWVGQRLGAVFGQRTQLWWSLTPLDSFQMLKHIYDIPQALYEENLKMFVDLLGLESFLSQPVRKLSLGQRVRADLAASLLHSPPVLFLDEPMLGMDVVVKDRVHSLIRYLSREQGATVLLTTHDLHDLETICPRAIILNKGQIAFDGTIEALKSRVGGQNILRCTLSASDLDPASSIRQLDWLGADTEYHPESRELCIRFDTNRTPAAALIRVLLDHYAVENLALDEPPIEDLIKPFYLEAGKAGDEQVPV